jgi:hypothetical protein|tara:strand:- start:13 stop:1146 length:1134 start_codon:yes stop_codon:yes gene_type:complete
MHYFEYATKDTTLYENSGSRNTGLDEILEVRKDMNAAGTVVNVSRALIKFDLTYISESINSGLITNPTYYLNLYDANSTGLNVSQNLYAYPVSQSWENGSGREDSNPAIEDGCGWFYKDNGTTKTQWTSEMTSSGGTWYTGSDGQYTLEASQSFTNEPSDVRMDVSGIVNNWIYSGSTYPNEGFMLKRTGSLGNTDTSLDEGSTTHLGHFSFFSRETHTIYQPRLEVVWDDSKWTTGSLSALSNTDLEDVQIYQRGLKRQYKENSKVKLRVVGRERYPEKTFSATAGYSTGYTTVKYLPSGSTYYQIRDAYTGDIIVPFGSGSVVSCDSTGNYFNLWMNGLLAERFYRVEYKIVSGSGTADETIQYFDELSSFKVVR